MRTVLTFGVWLIAVVAAIVAAHLAIIEVGREVVTLRTADEDGTVLETRLWIVDVDGAAWLHSAGPAWAERFQGSPVVEVDRDGQTGRYTAILAPERHPEIDAALRRKYGLADRWVRFLAPCSEDTIPVRLDAVADT